MHVRCEGSELSLFGQPRSGRQSVVFMMSHEFERDFGATTLLFSVALLLGVQLENSGIMLSKFHSDSLHVTNPCFVGHSWVGLGPILSYRHV
jgi:low temperature requirement protein LtrA